MENLTTGNKIVDELGKLNLHGNIIPHAWYQTLKMESGKPDTVSMLLLSDFIYWYRPTYLRDEDTGQLAMVKKKFKGDLLQKSYKQLTEQFGFSSKQIREALIRLENKGVLTRVFKTVDSPIGKLPNTMFIELHPSEIVKTCFPQSKEVFTLKETPISPEGKTITKITTDITTENLSCSSSDDEKEAVKEIMKFWDDNGFGFNNMNAKTELLAYLDEGFEAAVILESLKIASEVDRRNLKYIKGILHKWENEGAKTIQQVNAYMEHYKANKGKGGKGNGSTKQSNGKPSEQTGSKYSL